MKKTGKNGVMESSHEVKEEQHVDKDGRDE